MMVIQNNFYINILNRIVYNGKRYYLNFVFSIRYFAHDGSRHTHTHRHIHTTHTHTHSHTHTHNHTHTQSHTHTHTHTHTYIHTHTYTYIHRARAVSISLWYLVRGRSWASFVNRCDAWRGHLIRKHKMSFYKFLLELRTEYASIVLFSSFLV